MAVMLKHPVSAGWLCQAMGLRLIGPDRNILSLCALEALAEDGLSFALPGKGLGELHGGTVFGPGSLGGNGVSIIGSEDPRYDFIRAQYVLAADPGFAREAPPPDVHPSVRIAPGAVIE